MQTEGSTILGNCLFHVDCVYLQRQITSTMCIKVIDYRKTNTLRIKAKALPNYKEFISLVEKDKRVQRYNTMQDMILDAFEWDKTPQGHDYWQAVHDSIELRPQPNCPKCNGIARVWLLKTVNKYKCQKCKITFL